MFEWFFENVVVTIIAAVLTTIIGLLLKSWQQRLKDKDDAKATQKVVAAGISSLVLLVLIGLIYFSFFVSEPASSVDNLELPNSSAVNNQLEQQRATAQNLMYRLHAEVSNLRVKFETYNVPDTSNPGNTVLTALILNEIRKEADILIDELQSVNDSLLVPGFSILKHDHLTYVLTMAAEVEEPKVVRKKELIRKALEQSETVKFLVRKAQERQNSDDDTKKLQKWIKENQTLDRVYTLRAWLFAIDALTDEIITPLERSKVLEEWNKVSTTYRTRYPLSRNPSLKKFN